MPRTILYLTPSVKLLGARQSLLALARALDPLRYRPIVCCQTRGQLTDELEKSCIPAPIIPTGWWRKARYWPGFPLAILRLRQLILRENVDLIHCNEIYPNPFAVLAGKLTGRPVITHMRLSVTPELTRKYHLHRAQKIVVVSEGAGHDFDHWPDKSKKVVTIHNGVELDKYRLETPRERLRRDLGLSPGDFVIGQIATWAHRKRQHVAIEAMGLIAQCVPQAQLLIVGGAARSQMDYEAELRSLAAKLNLERRVRFIPFTEDIAPIYNALDVNLLISGDEGFGRTIIESGSLGIPTIGAIAGGIPEVIRDGSTGWLVPVDSPQMVAERIEMLANKPDQLKSAGQEAQRFVTEHFSIEHHTRQIMGLYDLVLKDWGNRNKAGS